MDLKKKGTTIMRRYEYLIIYIAVVVTVVLGLLLSGRA